MAIRHIVLFKLRPGWSFDDPEVQAAVRSSEQVGDHVPQLLDWRVGRNVSPRAIAYDFVAIGLVPDATALQEYLDHPFHRSSADRWQAIGDWVVADIEEADGRPL